MSDELKNKVNTIAENAFELKEAGNKSGYKTEHNKIAAMLLNESQKYIPSKVNRDNYFGCVCKVIVECLCNWKPGKYGFYECYIHILKLRLKDVYIDDLDTLEKGAKNKLGREMRGLTDEEKADLKPKFIRDDSYNAPDDENRVKLVASDENIEDDFLQADNDEQLFHVLTEAVLTQKKKYENRKTLCYSVYFYTEYITTEIHEGKYPDIYKKCEEKLMRIIDHDFITYYMDGDNNSVAEIKKGKLKKLSCFTGNPKDEKPCGYPLVKEYVYVNYISMIKNHSITPSGISDQKKRFYKLIAPELKKNFVD